MKFDLLFYLSRKTSLCEKKLTNILKQQGITPNTTAGATTPLELGELLTSSLSACYLVFIIGALGTGQDNSLETVLSRVVSNTRTRQITTQKIKNSVTGNDGYLLQCGSQFIVALPDSPAEIEAMLTQQLTDYISAPQRQNAGK